MTDETKRKHGEDSDDADEALASDSSAPPSGRGDEDEGEGEERPELSESSADEALLKSAAMKNVGMEEGQEDAFAAPSQLGHRRFVYAAYFAGGIAVAFLAEKFFNLAWAKGALYKPALGEPRDEVIMPLAAALGAGLAFYYWRRTRARELAEEVASELSKVTWPDKKEVTNSTTVVIVTTAVATIFFALMDRFWGFVTNLVYGS